MSFDGSEFVERVGKRLLNEFSISSDAGTPGLTGAAKEHPARQQLERLMPHTIGVGSGLLVDSQNGISKQQDIVVYERLSPTFSINDTAEATFFPIEGVISVGEVKTQLGKAELKDAFEKCKSVKILRRHAQRVLNISRQATVSFRSYGSVQAFTGTPAEGFNQDTKWTDQVLFFVLCEKFSSSSKTTLENYSELCAEFGKHLAPDLIVSLHDGIIYPHNSAANARAYSVIDSDNAAFSQIGSSSFSTLLSYLRDYAFRGRTVQMSAYDRYFFRSGATIDLKPSLSVKN